MTSQPRQPDWTYTPARDHGLGEIERLKSTSREPGLLSSTAHSLACHSLSAYFRTYHRLRVEGRALLPAKPPFVVIANHASHLDQYALLGALPLQMVTNLYIGAAADRWFLKGRKELTLQP